MHMVPVFMRSTGTLINKTAVRRFQKWHHHLDPAVVKNIGWNF